MDTESQFTHVWDEFFAGNYDDTPGSEAWYGYFDGNTLRRPPKFAFDVTDPEGRLRGDASLKIMVRDFNGDGVLSEAEREQNCQMTVTLVFDERGGKGAFRGMCGTGALGGGNFNFVDPPDDDDIQLVGNLTLYPCN